ncbi:MAG: hypothetical protein M0041_03400 [Nitrospiraceae bacterium]|nr:hypothetical protein [Nitrospiraceae bacterium]
MGSPKRYKSKPFKSLSRALSERAQKHLETSLERIKKDLPDSYVFVYTVGNTITFLSDPGLSNSTAVGMLERAKFDLLMKVDA